MAVTLGTGDSSYFTIDGLPYQRGDLRPIYNHGGVGYVSFRWVEGYNNELFGNFHYSDYIDASTGNPFASFSALATWIAGNVFGGTVSGSSTTPISFMKLLTVSAAPALSDEIAEGASITHPFLDTIDVLALTVNGNNYQATTDFTQTDDTIDFSALSLVASDVVILFGTPKVSS